MELSISHYRIYHGVNSKGIHEMSNRHKANGPLLRSQAHQAGGVMNMDVHFGGCGGGQCSGVCLPLFLSLPQVGGEGALLTLGELP